jgi:hypothetical protein
MRVNPSLSVALSFALTSALWGCGGDDHDPHDPDEEACEHLADGPATAVTASDTTALAPQVSNDHRRYDVTLIEVTGGNGGFVSFNAAEAADYVVFFDANVPLAVTDSSGGEVEIEDSATSSETCAEIAGRHVIPFTVGTHYLELGPSPLDAVGIVIEELGDDH